MNDLKGRIDVTREEYTALDSGYLLKKTMLNKCPKKGEQIGAFLTEKGIREFIRCEIYHKELLGSGPPGKAYRVIFGRLYG